MGQNQMVSYLKSRFNIEYFSGDQCKGKPTPSSSPTTFLSNKEEATSESDSSMLCSIASGLSIVALLFVVGSDDLGDHPNLVGDLTILELVVVHHQSQSLTQRANPKRRSKERSKSRSFSQIVLRFLLCWVYDFECRDTQS